MTPSSSSRALLPHVLALSRPPALRSWISIAYTWGFLWATLAVFAHSPGPLAFAVCALLIAAKQNAALTLEHEAWHHLLFENTSLNHRVGAWLTAYPFGSPYRLSRQKHFDHHGRVGSKNDPKRPFLGRPERDTPGSVILHFLRILFGRLVAVTLARTLLAAGPKSPSPAGQPPGWEKRGEWARLVPAQIAVFALVTMITHRWWAYPALWLFPLVSLTPFLQAVRRFVEHTPAAPVTSRHPRDHYYSIRCNRLEAFFFGPYHFNYHLEHHEFPFVPHTGLPSLKSLLLQDSERAPFYKERPGYLRFVVSYTRSLPARPAREAA